MNSFIALLLLAFVYNAEACRKIYLKKHYEIEDGLFILFEHHEDSIILNEYPAFYSEDKLPLSKINKIYTL